MAPTRPARSLKEGNKPQRVNSVLPLTRAQAAAGKRVFVADVDGQERIVDPARKREISNMIVFNTVGETLETALVDLEYWGQRKHPIDAMQRGHLIDAIRSLNIIRNKFTKNELWEVIGALCKLAENKKIDIDVRMEAIESISLMYGAITGMHEDANSNSEAHETVLEGHPIGSIINPKSIREAMGTQMQKEMAHKFIHLASSKEEGIAEAVERVIRQIDSPLLKRPQNAAIFLNVPAEKIASALSAAQSKAEFIASMQELKKIALKLGLDALWKIMDALCELAGQSETPIKVRIYAFNSMPPLYKRIAAKIAEENVQEICYSEAKMAKVLVNASLGGCGEQLIEAATQAMDNVSSPVVQNMLLNCAFIGETKDRDEMAHQIKELDGNTKLRDTAMDVSLATFLYAMED